GIRDFHVTGVQTCALPIYEVFLLTQNQHHNRSPASHQGRRGFRSASLATGWQPLWPGMLGNSPHKVGSHARDKALSARRIDHLRSEEHTSELQSRENLVCR